MDLDELRRIADGWVSARGKYGDAWEKLDAYCDTAPSTALRIIEEIQFRLTDRTPIDYELMSALAAGPLEDLLARHGDEVIDEVERMAGKDPEFRKCLSGVWRNAMSHELYARVQKAADSSFRFGVA
jgi:hypothetical protein